MGEGAWNLLVVFTVDVILLPPIEECPTVNIGRRIEANAISGPGAGCSSLAWKMMLSRPRSAL